MGVLFIFWPAGAPLVPPPTLIHLAKVFLKNTWYCLQSKSAQCESLVPNGFNMYGRFGRGRDLEGLALDGGVVHVLDGRLRLVRVPVRHEPELRTRER